MIQFRQFSEALQSSLKKCYEKLDQVKSEVFTQLNTTKEDLKERISDLDKVYQEQMEEMNNGIEAVRILARDSVNTKEKELTDLVDRNMTKI